MRIKEFDDWIKKVKSRECIDLIVPDRAWIDNIKKFRSEYCEEEILEILRFILGEYTAGIDSSNRDLLYNQEYISFVGEERIQQKMKTEYWNRLKNGQEAWEGLTWVLEYVKIKPIQASKILAEYLSSEAVITGTDCRIISVTQAIDIIEAYYIQYADEKEIYIMSLTPRRFEKLIYKLFVRMGYEAILTPSTRDGGKDVIASKRNERWDEKLYIECKHYRSTELTREKVNAFVGVISEDRSVSRGLMFVTNKVSDTLKDAKEHIQIIELNELIIMMNSYFGFNWELCIDSIIDEEH